MKVYSNRIESYNTLFLPMYYFSDHFLFLMHDKHILSMLEVNS